MAIKRLDQATLNKWVDGVISKSKVYGVQAKGDRFAFAPLAKASDLRLDYDVTILGPKKFFEPPEEQLLSFSRKGEFKSILADESFVLLGVHPYDVHAINQMDIIFMKDGECDVHYQTRRNAATIVACDVQKASENVFAGCMNTATVDKGFDILLTKTGGVYIADIRTDKGNALFANMSGLKDATKDDLKKRDAVWKDNQKNLRKHVLKPELSGIPGLLDKSMDHPVWEEKAKLCYSCGSCNLVCPTCYCFDVQDDVNWDMETGKRCRLLDGCLVKDFATVAGEHNFRKNRSARYRHRYYRKGKWAAAKVNQIACVGCGRCITACTSKIANPVEVYNRLLEGR
jgi:ferredoxin